MATKTIFITSGSTWVVPDDWNSANNAIYAIGGGQGGYKKSTSGSAGGVGADLSYITNFALTPGSTVYVNIGGGSVTTTTTAPAPGGNTWLNKTTNAAPASTADGVLARGGASAATNVGTAYAGGAYGSGSSSSGGGGGGAGGPNGPGVAGVSAAPSAGGAGGAGGAFTGGSPGNGGSAPSGNGGNGGGWTQTSNGAGAGPGGGGAGGAYGSTAGGNGGGYGAGGGGSYTNSNPGSGASGILVITYTPVPKGRSFGAIIG